MARRPVRVIQADPEDVPNHNEERTLIEYQDYKVVIGPAIRGFSVDGSEPKMLPVEHNGLSMKIVTADDIEEETIDRVYMCFTGGKRYEAFMKASLKVMQVCWRAAEARESAESVDFLLGMLEILSEARDPFMPDGTHREASL